MDSKFKVLGHAAHPILIVFPLGLLATSVIFDIIRLVSGDPQFANVAFWLTAGGVIGGLVAAVPGVVDWLGIPPGTRAKQVGLLHAAANVLALVLFAASWKLRNDAADRIGGNTPLVIAMVGLVMALFGGWLGGELVERLGMSIHDGAHLDAPSSLSGRSAKS